jgi:hypothetical protein
MAKISKGLQDKANTIAKTAVEAWVWAIGENVNPDILTVEVVEEAYEGVRKAIRGQLDQIAKKAGQPGYAELTLRGFFGEVWKTIAATGVFIAPEQVREWTEQPDGSMVEQWVETGKLHNATAADLRKRLFKSDQFARVCFDQWHSTYVVNRSDKRSMKQEIQILWNQRVFDAMTKVCSDLIKNASSSPNPKVQAAALVTAITWFTGRRAWVETALRLEILPCADKLPWADDTIFVTGLGKKTQNEKLGLREVKVLRIPLFGISSEQIIWALAKLREVEANQLWFRPELDTGNHEVEAGLRREVGKLFDGPIKEAFAPVFVSGRMPREFSLKSFRQLWVSHGYPKQEAWAEKTGSDLMNLNGYAKKFIGHQGNNSDADTAEYLVWKYLGDAEIKPVSQASISTQSTSGSYH